MKKLSLDVPSGQTSGTGEEEETGPSGSSSPTEAEKIVVGYALTAKKIKSFMQGPLIRMARSKGVEFVPIDVDKALSDQGPFHIILHKIEGNEWAKAVESVNPDVIVLDPPHAIQCVRNRQLMLEAVPELNLPDGYGTVSTPKQLVISESPTSIQDEVTRSGLQVPLVVKPLIVDDTEKSHELSIAHDLDSLSVVDLPVVIQEFINHDAVLFKIFIVGETIKVVRRSSLHDVTKSDNSKGSGMHPFQRISSAAASENVDLNPSSAAEPPQPLIDALATALRRQLELHLFNIDMIRKAGTNDYYVIDINYFPGYGKMPDYERIFTDFFVDLVRARQTGTTTAG